MLAPKGPSMAAQPSCCGAVQDDPRWRFSNSSVNALEGRKAGERPFGALPWQSRSWYPARRVFRR